MSVFEMPLGVWRPDNLMCDSKVIIVHVKQGLKEVLQCHSICIIHTFTMSFFFQFIAAFWRIRTLFRSADIGHCFITGAEEA